MNYENWLSLPPSPPRLAQRRQQEETDANMARQVSQKNTRQRRPQEQGLSERDVQRMKQVQIQDGGSNRYGISFVVHLQEDSN